MELHFLWIIFFSSFLLILSNEQFSFQSSEKKVFDPESFDRIRSAKHLFDAEKMVVLF